MDRSIPYDEHYYHRKLRMSRNPWEEGVEKETDEKSRFFGIGGLMGIIRVGADSYLNKTGVEPDTIILWPCEYVQLKSELNAINPHPIQMLFKSGDNFIIPYELPDIDEVFGMKIIVRADDGQ